MASWHSHGTSHGMSHGQRGHPKGNLTGHPSSWLLWMALARYVTTDVCCLWPFILTGRDSSYSYYCYRFIVSISSIESSKVLSKYRTFFFSIIYVFNRTIHRNSWYDIQHLRPPLYFPPVFPSLGMPYTYDAQIILFFGKRYNEVPYYIPGINKRAMILQTIFLPHRCSRPQAFF